MVNERKLVVELLKKTWINWSFQIFFILDIFLNINLLFVSFNVLERWKKVLETVEKSGAIKWLLNYTYSFYTMGYTKAKLLYSSFFTVGLYSKKVQKPGLFLRFLAQFRLFRRGFAAVPEACCSQLKQRCNAIQF